MAKRRKKKQTPVIHLSAGPLPTRLAADFADTPLVFSDASHLRHGGLAAVLFADHESAADIRTRSVASEGSNTLELRAALFALGEAWQAFAARPFALFSDNQDAVSRLQQAQQNGLAQDPALGALASNDELPHILATARIRWIKSHASCRGNALADEHARLAAS